MTVWDNLAKPNKDQFSLRLQQSTSYGNWSWLRDFDGRVGVALEMRTLINIPDIQSTKYFEIGVVNAPHVGNILTIVCKDFEFHEIFEVLCRDLISIALKSQEIDIALALVADRVSIWTKLFSKGFKGLSQLKIFGLAAELVFLEQWISSNFSESILGWGGPDGTSQDFISSRGNKAIEVKVCSDSHNLVKISSLEQLDFDGELYLAVCPVTQSKEGTHFETLDSLVKKVSALLNVQDCLKFERKLLNIGYIHGEYESYRMNIGQLNFYTVSPGFPRLIRANIPENIVSCKYEIDLDAYSNFKIKIYELVAEWIR